ncbi:ribosome recycling factor [Pseudodesulfovibrio sp.]|uniref:ribosome recycling factor n=1 Tax=Pseudodesulfovibrio sp. TaxID=2035812 RepID=UPI0026020CAA|nr:ribosome recycling factor [Pseudodesulfovibrio sp.]MDD3313525.1 ribosome recycling factor [Pseudodesulfovibrio sp.]
MQALLDDGKKRMAGAIAALKKDFAKLRTGRATTALVDDIVVDYYGTPTPISQLASVSVPDSRTITIQPWDKGAFGSVEKAIMASDLGLNPVNDGKIIRIAIPPLTEERRKELVKVAKKYTEDCKIAVRNIRRDMNDSLKKLEKDKEISEDERKKGEADVQKITDDHVKLSDDTMAAKEKEILEI